MIRSLTGGYRFSHGKKAWFLNHVNDEYVKKAQTYNFRSRASFKLLQIEEKHKVIQKHTKILDLGSAPGSWCQAAQTINPAVVIAAVDLLPMKEIDNVDFYQTDARSQVLHKILKEKHGLFDVIISDMAPNFSGTLFQTHKQAMELNKLCLELCLTLGTQHCNLIMKTIQGQHEKHLVMLLEYFYKEVSRFKPKSSRKQSAQHYLICKLRTPSSPNLPSIILKLQQSQVGSLKSKRSVRDFLEGR